MAVPGSSILTTHRLCQGVGDTRLGRDRDSNWGPGNRMATHGQGLFLAERIGRTGDPFRQAHLEPRAAPGRNARLPPVWVCADGCGCHFKQSATVSLSLHRRRLPCYRSKRRPVWKSKPGSGCYPASARLHHGPGPGQGPVRHV